jgi:cystathionine gamma-synthase
MKIPHDAAFATRAIHAGQVPDPTTGAIMMPIYQTSTYTQDGVGGLRGGYEYSRSANPTRTALEEALALLSGEEPGAALPGGGWTADSIFARVASTLDRYQEISRLQGKKEKAAT